MSIWIRAVCTRSVGALARLELRAATRDADFLTWGEDCGLDEAEAARVERALRFGRTANPNVVEMYYRPDDPAWSISIERWVGGEAAEELEELRERLVGRRGAKVTRIRDLLRRGKESIGFELKASDARSIGYPIAWQTAMWLAARGKGLVVTDDPDLWWDPTSYEVLLEE